MELIGLRCGEIRADAGLLYRGELSDDRVVIPIMCFAITHPEGVVLFDTGMNPRVRSDPVGYWGRVVERDLLVPVFPDGAAVTERLQQAGIAMSDVRFVVNSHLHNDHAGMNCFFNDSIVLMRTREFEHATEQMDKPYSGYIGNDFQSGDAGGLRMIEFDETYDIFDDGLVVLVSTIGHTPGHQSLRVRFPSGKGFTLSGDAMYQRSSLCTGCPPGVVWDRDLAIASISKLKAMNEHGDAVLVNHDPEMWGDCVSTQLLHSERLGS
ncbi:MAG: N-acyl homoserine lactone hydrolase [Acidimicrobiaceae bacterium]